MTSDKASARDSSSREAASEEELFEADEAQEPEEVVAEHIDSVGSLGMAGLGPPRDATWDRVGRRVLRWIAFGNNLLLLPMFTVMVLEVGVGHRHRHREGYELANLLFCVAFQLEVWLGLALARDRRRYATDFSNIIDFISSLPVAYVLQGLRVARLIRIFRLFRLVVRLRRFQNSGARLFRAGLFVLALMVSGALALEIVEPDATSTFENALWWSVVTVSTVGYGDITPVTPAGHMVASVLIISGIGVFGYMAGFMVSLLEGEEDDKEARALQEQLQAIRAELATISSQLAAREDADEAREREASERDAGP